MDVYSGGHQIRIGAKSPDDKMIITGRVVFNYGDLYNQNYQYNNGPLLDSLFRSGMRMQVYTSKDTYTTTIDDPFIKGMNSLRRINIHKETSVDLQTIHMKDLKCFEYCADDTREIFMPPDTVNECLDKILQVQYPQQHEMKKGIIIPDKRPIIQAKIFTLAA